ncbi:hypothetical protein FF098_012340 [Parvularcula flava]|uniref:Uncharacterized protein n=1 Tax=Aquisalinus luteolus TaxID=1566827 RepID=A0A8J3A4S7_9PROT|nr:hypothetical protein [Aquisalinus luteolus]NHK28700.1 hypothetical protein [Aquisalinus luteolus]GGH99255.1 hypothetical protein GCM10011355_24780 [Aquisalinus luteolus]
MTDHEKDFSELELLWQEPDTERPVISVARLRLTIWRMRIFLLMELMVCATACVFGLWLLVRGEWLPALATIVFAVAGGVLALWSRLPHLGIGDEALAPHIENAIAEARGKVRAASAGIGVCCAAQIFTGLIALDALSTGEAPARTLLPIVFFCFATPAIILFSLRSQKKARQQLASLLAMKEQDADQPRAGMR